MCVVWVGPAKQATIFIRFAKNLLGTSPKEILELRDFILQEHCRDLRVVPKYSNADNAYML